MFGSESPAEVLRFGMFGSEALAWHLRVGSENGGKTKGLAHGITL